MSAIVDKTLICRSIEVEDLVQITGNTSFIGEYMQELLKRSKEFFQKLFVLEEGKWLWMQEDWSLDWVKFLRTDFSGDSDWVLYSECLKSLK